MAITPKTVRHRRQTRSRLADDKCIIRKVPIKLVSFLNQVDAEYMKAFSTYSVSALKVNMSKDCLSKLANEIFKQQSVRYFAASKFRNTTWEFVDSTYKMILLKTVEFGKLNVCGVEYRVCHNYKQLWFVEEISNGFIITDIKEVVEDA